MLMRGIALFKAGIAAGFLAASPAAAVQTLEEAEETYAERCTSDALSIDSSFETVDRVLFLTPNRKPALLIVCIDSSKIAAEVPITNVSTALVFMAYKEFAPFWPAAEKRWGADLSILRNELRDFPLAEAVKAYPYSRQMGARYARAISKSRLALGAGDFDDAVAILERERDYILELREKRNGRTTRDFELSLVVANLASTVALRDGAAPAAELLDSFLAGHAISDEYKPNLETNHAAFLAESGRADDALRIIEPAYERFGNRQDRGASYRIAGSRREFAWILACAHSLRGEADKAGRYVDIVNRAQESPVDSYLPRTKRSVHIRMRMNKCMGDEAAFLETLRSRNEAALASTWLEYQVVGRPSVGRYKMSSVTQGDEGKALSSAYRQLPASYAPALNLWRPLANAED